MYPNETHNTADNLMKISKINDQLYLSGVFPMDQNSHCLRDKNIKYILCCVDTRYAQPIHEKIIKNDPEITILYLPYNDIVNQNLWQTNWDNIKITSPNTNHNNQLLKYYKGRPMIEIGYHFINHAIQTGNNILVHCMAGISRSVSLVIYYYMKKMSKKMDDVLKYIRSKRAIADPNESFKRQLSLYEKKRDTFTESDATHIIKNL